MQTKNKSGLEQGRNFALWFTICAAVLAGVVELVKAAESKTPSWLNTTDNVVLVALCVGGVVMGVLYLLHLLTRSRT